VGIVSLFAQPKWARQSLAANEAAHPRRKARAAASGPGDKDAAAAGGPEEGAEAGPQQPKRPQNAYWLWLSEHREELVKDAGSNAGSRVSVLAGERWRVLPAEEKEPYESAAAAMRLTYEDAMKEFVTQGGLPTRPGQGKAVGKKRRRAKQSVAGDFFSMFTPEQDDPRTPRRARARHGGADGATPGPKAPQGGAPAEKPFELDPRIFDKVCDLAGPGESPEGFRLQMLVACLLHPEFDSAKPDQDTEAAVRGSVAKLKAWWEQQSGSGSATAALAATSPDVLELMLEEGVAWRGRKASRIVAIAAAVAERFSGQVPAKRQSLLTLPGIGPKAPLLAAIFEAVGGA